MTKKEYRAILLRIDEVKEELREEESLMVDDSKLVDIDNYRIRLKELKRLKMFRDSYRGSKKKGVK